MVARRREDLHRLIDALPESELPAVRSYLRYLRDVTADPVKRAVLSAPVDDEPLTDEDTATIREAREQVRRGEVKTLEDVRRELGL